MTLFCILATTDDFLAIERVTTDWFKQPVSLISENDHNWRVCLPDTFHFGIVLNFYVVRRVMRFRLEARELPQPVIIHREIERGE